MVCNIVQPITKETKLVSGTAAVKMQCATDISEHILLAQAKLASCLSVDVESHLAILWTTLQFLNK